jgi:hypothetical protein
MVVQLGCVGWGGPGGVKQFARPWSVNNYLLHKRVILKVMKTQHQNPEFGVRLKRKTLQKSTLAFKWGKTQKTINFGGKSCLSIAATYIFTALTYTITIITLRDLIKFSFFFCGYH